MKEEFAKSRAASEVWQTPWRPSTDDITIEALPGTDHQVPVATAAFRFHNQTRPGGETQTFHGADSPWAACSPAAFLPSQSFQFRRLPFRSAFQSDAYFSPADVQPAVADEIRRVRMVGPFSQIFSRAGLALSLMTLLTISAGCGGGAGC